MEKKTTQIFHKENFIKKKYSIQSRQNFPFQTVTETVKKFFQKTLEWIKESFLHTFTDSNFSKPPKFPSNSPTAFKETLSEAVIFFKFGVISMEAFNSFQTFNSSKSRKTPNFKWFRISEVTSLGTTNLFRFSQGRR
jgi:hypothetical protein